jgi:hypothetical protein
MEGTSIIIRIKKHVRKNKRCFGKKPYKSGNSTKGGTGE